MKAELGVRADNIYYKIKNYIHTFRPLVILNVPLQNFIMNFKH